MDLLERNTELATLKSMWAPVRSGSGRLAVVEGAAGHGKSALLAAATKDAAEAGVRVLSARGGEMEAEIAFGTIRQLLERTMADLSAVERDRHFAGAAAPARRVIEPLNPASSPVAPADSFGALHGIYWLVSNVARGQPTLLVVDDAHWVDHSSIRALTYLTRRIADLPVAVVISLRPSEPGSAVVQLEELCAQPDAIQLRLRPLKLRSVTAVVRAALPDADDELCAACYSATAGNPFYVKEVLRTLSGDVAGVGEPVVRALTVPLLGERVLRRTARIDPCAVDVVAAMAVFGDGAKLADVAALARIDAVVAADVAAQLQRIDVLSEVDPVIFAHPLVRRCVYDALSVARRDVMHGQAAALLGGRGAGAEQVAVHLRLRRPAGRAEVAVALRAAARDAGRRGAPDAAIRWLDRALAEGATYPAQSTLLHELGRIELGRRDPAAITHLRAALDQVAPTEIRSGIARDLAEILMAAGRWEDGLQAIVEGIELLPGDDTELRVHLEGFRALIQAFDPRLAGAFSADRQRLIRLTSGESWPARALAAVLASVHVCRGQSLDLAKSLAERSLEGWQLFQEHDAGGWASPHALMALILLDENDAALAALDALASLSQRAGALIGTLTALGYRSWRSARLGDLVAAEGDIRTCVDASIANDMSLLIVTSAMLFIEPLIERPVLDDVASTIENVQVGPDFLATGGGGMLLEARGRLRLGRGDSAAGISDLRAAGRVFTDLEFGPPFTFWRSELALALPVRRRTEAEQLVEQENALAAITGLPRAIGIGLRATGMLAGHEDGLSDLAESVQLLRGTAARHELARSLVEHGAALRRAGRRTAARERLTEGLDLAHRCGADRLAGRALQELRASGARPRRVVRSGVDALTGSELRVIQLVAQGRSNPEVAQALFVSLKTVETHLQHAYAKLGLSGPGSRRRIADILLTS